VKGLGRSHQQGGSPAVEVDDLDATHRGLQQSGARRGGPMATTKTKKPSAPGEVDNYMKALKHPRAEVVEALRRIILKAHAEVGEEIKWNAPSFFFTGEMAPSDPKLYRRYLVVFNLFRKDCIRLVFWGGAKAKDPTGLLEGRYADGRRLARFYGMDDVKSKGTALRNVVRQQIKALDK
jgi:hypothetical protein